MAKHGNPYDMSLALESALRAQRAVNQIENRPPRHRIPESVTVERPRLPVGTVYVGRRTGGVFRVIGRRHPLRIDQ